MSARQLDRRILAAVRLVDGVTGAPATGPLSVSDLRLADGARVEAVWTMNRSGVAVLTELEDADGLAATFDLASSPSAFATPPRPMTALASDASGRYLPRRFALVAPTLPDSSGVTLRYTSFDIKIFPAPASPVRPTWAQLRARVLDAEGRGVGGALLILRWGSPVRETWGQSDARGEALLPVAGVPASAWDAATSALLTEVPATVLAVADPALGPSSGPPDLDALAAREGSLPSTSASLSLMSGRVSLVTLTLPGAPPSP